MSSLAHNRQQPGDLCGGVVPGDHAECDEQARRRHRGDGLGPTARANQRKSEQYLIDYWSETVRTVGARRVVLIHWDDFFRPLHKPLRALPYAVDDLDVSMRVLCLLAGDDGVPLHLPTLWQRSDPWS